MRETDRVVFSHEDKAQRGDDETGPRHAVSQQPREGGACGDQNQGKNVKKEREKTGRKKQGVLRWHRGQESSGVRGSSEKVR